MQISYIIVTRNRRETLLRTLEHLRANTPLPEGKWEVWVVDNASTDGTAEALRSQVPWVRLIERPGNEGVGARSHAFPRAAGRYVFLLDDDSYPVGDTVTRSMAHLSANPQVGSLTGRVILPGGQEEACALPGVLISCATCLPRSVIRRVGPFRPEFFRKAGEYDYSFRIWRAGYRVERCEAAVYRHDKVMTGRSVALSHRMDLRNNLILAHRFLPQPLRGAYTADWSIRYRALARHAGVPRAARRARVEAALWGWRERMVGRELLEPEHIESIFQLNRQAELIRQWAVTHAVRRAVIAGFSKNLYATWRGCREAGVAVSALADDHEAYQGMSYRGVPVRPTVEAIAEGPDGVILSNINPAQIDRAESAIRVHCQRPILRLWTPGKTEAGPSESGSSESGGHLSAVA